MTTIKLKNGSGAPLAGDLVQGEPALDLTNKRLYTEDSGGTVIEVGTNPGEDVTFADNRKAIFGAGSDLQIYHDGSDSYLKDSGNGDLIIQAYDDIKFQQSTDNADLVTINTGGNVTIHSGNLDVTGTVTSTDATTGFVTNATNGFALFTADPDNYNISRSSTTVSVKSGGTINFIAGAAQRVRFADNGDVSLYEDSGTTAKFFWDASAESLTLGNGGSEGTLNVGGSASAIVARFTDATTSSVVIRPESGGAIIGTDGGGTLHLASNGSTLSDRKMTITTTGNVGIGTSSPGRLVDLKVSDNTDGARLRLRSATAIDSHPTIGSVEFYSDDNSTNSTGIVGSIDVEGIGTWNGAANSSAMTFNLIQGLAGTTSPVEAMRVDASGNLLVGTIGLDAQQGFAVEKGDATNIQIMHNFGQASGTTYAQFLYATGAIGSITQNGTTGIAYNTSSDYRLKENVVPLTGAIDRVKQLKPSRFNFIADADTTVDGFLAHEVADVVPEAITGTKDAMRDEEYEVTPAVYEDVVIPAVLDEEGNEVEAERTEQQLVSEAVMGTRSVPDYQGIDQSKLVPLLVATIQELEARITALESN